MITRQDALRRAQNDDDKLFIAHMYDLFALLNKTGRPAFTGFADPRLIALCENMLKDESVYVRTFGGYEDAERKMIGIFPCGFDDESFPIYAVLVSADEPDALSHRDYMGAVLSLGITRAHVGDIVLVDEGCVVLTTEKMADFIKDELTSVGSQPVKCNVALPDDLKLIRRTQTIEGTVAAPRADAVVALFCNLSRTKSADAFKKGFVTVNYQPLFDPSKKLCEGDIIAVRGYGKALLSDFGNMSKKGRMFLTLKKYV